MAKTVSKEFWPRGLILEYITLYNLTHTLDRNLNLFLSDAHFGFLDYDQE